MNLATPLDTLSKINENDAASGLKVTEISMVAASVPVSLTTKPAASRSSPSF